MSAALKPLDIPSRNVAAMPRALELYPRRAACANWHVIEADESRVIPKAALWLSGLHFEVYLPKFPVYMQDTIAGQRAPSRSWCWRPRFYQFFFVRFAANDAWQQIRSENTNGIRRLLMSPGQIPHSVPNDLVEWLQIDEARRTAEIETETRRKTKMTPFQPGALVMVKTTPIGVDSYGADVYHHMAGTVCEVVTCNGKSTTALAPMFGGKVPVMFSRSELSDE